MKANQIREIRHRFTDGAYESQARKDNEGLIQKEIAAQLAELNETLKSILDVLITNSVPNA